MAGDGLSHSPEGLVCNLEVAKVRRLADGRIFGLAGSPFDLDPVEQWLNEGGEFPPVNHDFDLLVLEPDGKVYSYNEHGYRTLELLPAAIGSGTELAVGAMEAGATPLAAVAIACKRQRGCAGTIVCLALDQ
jgi:ATP-dependent protease HslVU (ClpYQ) peptidase subunit